MSTEPLVSIVTPVYNQASMIEQTLVSVASQTYPRVEHIVIDGGSTDGTVDAIKSFAQHHPLTWISEPDDGMYDVINKGLARAQGDILAYLNGDDLYLPWSVEVAAQEIRKGADFVYGDLAIVKRNKKRFFVQFYPPFNMNLYTHFETIAQPTMFWRKAVYQIVSGFDASFKYAGDSEYWLRGGAADFGFSHVHEILAIQVDHDQTLRKTFTTGLNAELRRIKEMYTKDAGPPRHPRWNAVQRALVWRLRQSQLLLAMRASRPKKWARFVEWLRTGVAVESRRPWWTMLPGPLWPREPTLADFASIDRKLAAEFGDGNSPSTERPKATPL